MHAVRFMCLRIKLVKWKATLAEQLDKILPLHEGILAEVVDDEKSTKEDVKAQSSESQATSSLLNENGHMITANSATQKGTRVKLPKLEVTKFNGKLYEWQDVWDSFESAIHTNELLSNVDKFSYLRELLLEPARSAIAGFALTSVNYESAVDLLQRQCGKKTTIQQELVNELLNARPIYSDKDMARL